jgi:hypothetical protein
MGSITVKNNKKYKQSQFKEMERRNAPPSNDYFECNVLFHIRNIFINENVCANYF